MKRCLFVGLILILSAAPAVGQSPDGRTPLANNAALQYWLAFSQLPATGDVVEWDRWRFEVVDMDGKRVDKVLVTPLTNPGEDL